MSGEVRSAKHGYRRASLLPSVGSPPAHTCVSWFDVELLATTLRRGRDDEEVEPVISLVAAALSLAWPVDGQIAGPPRARSVVLVHGAWADGSSRSAVIPILQAAGLHVTAVQNPLSSLADSVGTDPGLGASAGKALRAGRSKVADACMWQSQRFQVFRRSSSSLAGISRKLRGAPCGQCRRADARRLGTVVVHAPLWEKWAWKDFATGFGQEGTIPLTRRRKGF
jgi:hypothetical protein